LKQATTNQEHGLGFSFGAADSAVIETIGSMLELAGSSYHLSPNERPTN
jgi:hypothetical protein